MITEFLLASSYSPLVLVSLICLLCRRHVICAKQFLILSSFCATHPFHIIAPADTPTFEFFMLAHVQSWNVIAAFTLQRSLKIWIWD